jgi:hypothetical protein
VECAVALADDAGLANGIVQELGEVCFFHDSLSFSLLPAYCSDDSVTPYFTMQALL